MLLFWTLLLVNGVSGVEELRLIVGDSVTLYSAKIPSKETIQWLFGTTRLAEIKDGSGDLEYKNVTDFKDRLELDKKSGSLTIKNIDAKHSGEYKQYIANIVCTNKIIKVEYGAKKVSVKEGESVLLHTGLTEILAYDQILWKAEDDLIAEINSGTKLFLIYGRAEERFNDRLQLLQTGSLIISDSKNTDSGKYHLILRSSTYMYALHRTIRVTVKSPGLSSSVVAVIVLVVLLVVFAVTVVVGIHYLCRKISELQANRGATAGKRNGSEKRSDEAKALHQDTSIS